MSHQHQPMVTQKHNKVNLERERQEEEGKHLPREVAYHTES